MKLKFKHITEIVRNGMLRLSNLKYYFKQFLLFEITFTSMICSLIIEINYAIYDHISFSFSLIDLNAKKK